MIISSKKQLLEDAIKRITKSAVAAETKYIKQNKVAASEVPERYIRAQQGKLIPSDLEFALKKALPQLGLTEDNMIGYTRMAEVSNAIVKAYFETVPFSDKEIAAAREALKKTEITEHEVMLNKERAKKMADYDRQQERDLRVAMKAEGMSDAQIARILGGFRAQSRKRISSVIFNSPD